MLASGKYDENITLWDAHRGKQLASLNAFAVQLVFTPDGRELISCDRDENIFVWDARKGQLLRRFPNHESPIWSCCLGLSCDGRFLAVGGTYDGTFRIFEYATARLLEKFEGHHGFVQKLAFSPNGDMIASSGLDTVRLWRLQL
jgi:WD40 repeat protein